MSLRLFIIVCLAVFGSARVPVSLHADEPALIAPPTDRVQRNDLIQISGEKKCWHNVELNLQGPFAREQDQSPNPFTDYAMVARFRHESGTPDYFVLGYFAADGNAAETSASEGNIWRAHLSPNKSGRWSYEILFRAGPSVAFDFDSGKPLAPFDGLKGSFQVAPTDKKGRDLRAQGRLEYRGKRYLQFAESGKLFLKVGVDSPETLLAYRDFDGTVATPGEQDGAGPKPGTELKDWAAHLQDWRQGDPTWKDGKGKGLIGAMNYLADQGINSISFLTYNAGGDGDNVWPLVQRDNKFAYDCSKLDQWRRVFEHASAQGLHLHFKLQEQECDDYRRGASRHETVVREAFDEGGLGPERMLYLQQLVARFGHLLALNWNLGEENTQSTEEVKAMAAYIREIDPYRHSIVLHTFPQDQQAVYTPLLGDKDCLTGISLQNDFHIVHRLTRYWVEASRVANHCWVVANDEQGPAGEGVPCDPGYQGSDGTAKLDDQTYTQDDIRKLTLWGNLMAGGAGVEYYFGYRHPQNDLNCEDFRSRARLWKWSRLAIEFLREQKLPLSTMHPADELVGNEDYDNQAYVLAKPGSVYLVYLPFVQSTKLNLKNQQGEYDLAWFNPRIGGPLQVGSVALVKAGDWVDLGAPPSEQLQSNDDWLVVLRKRG